MQQNKQEQSITQTIAKKQTARTRTAIQHQQ